MARGRSFRRAQAIRAKARARRIIRLWGGTDAADDHYTHPERYPHWFGVIVSTHCCPCSCYMCRPHRWGDKSYRDLHEAMTLRDALAEADVPPSIYCGAT